MNFGRESSFPCWDSFLKNIVYLFQYIFEETGPLNCFFYRSHLHLLSWYSSFTLLQNQFWYYRYLPLNLKSDKQDLWTAFITGDIFHPSSYWMASSVPGSCSPTLYCLTLVSCQTVITICLSLSYLYLRYSLLWVVFLVHSSDSIWYWHLRGLEYSVFYILLSSRFVLYLSVF